MKINDLKERFWKQKYAMSCSETQRFYKTHLNAVLDYLKSAGIDEIEDLERDDVYEFTSYCRQKGLAQKTINHRINIIKQFIRLYKKDPDDEELKAILDMRVIKPVANSYMPLEEEQIRAFINYMATLDENKPNELKKKLVFELSIQNGVRNNELLELKVDEILFDERRIRLSYTKTREVRYAFYDAITERTLIKYLDVWCPKKWLFETSFGKMHRNRILHYFEQASEKLGFRVTPHILRATFATKSLKNGCDIESVRIMMGHSSLKTTQLYLHFTEEEVADENRRYNPLAFFGGKNWDLSQVPSF